MAGGVPVDLHGYQFIAKPLSKWRRFSGDFLPYWQASMPKFVLEVVRVGPPSQNQTITWFVRFANGQATNGQENIPPMQTGESVSLKVGGKLLGYTGDTLLILPVDLSSLSAEPYHTVYAFHTMPKVWISLAVVAGLLAGIFASLFQILFGL